MKFNNPLRCPQYVGISCIDGTCPIALADEYIEYGCSAIYECDDCWKYHGCDDCYFCFNGCPPELFVVYGDVSNNYRKMHGFPLLRKKHIMRRIKHV